MKRFKDKVVVITGGTDGIGKCLVEKFILMGASVATCGRNHDKIHNLQLSFVQFPLFAKIFDLSLRVNCESFIAEVYKYFGKIDILINNCGITFRSIFAESSLETFEKVIKTNLMSAVYCSQSALPYLLHSKGIIVNISSVAGFLGLPGRSAYCASKFAMNGFNQTLALELKQHNVGVILVMPGYTKTSIRKNESFVNDSSSVQSKLKEEKMMSVDYCANKIIEAIVKKKSVVIIGKQAKLIHFLSKYFPKITQNILYSFYYKDNKLIS